MTNIVPTRYICCRIKPAASPEESPTVISMHGHVWAENDAQAERMLRASRPTVVARPSGRPMRDTVVQMVRAEQLAQWLPASGVYSAPSAPNAE